MTLPNRPTLFLAHLQGAQNPDTKPIPIAIGTKELKMPTHNPPTQAHGILIIFTLNTQQPYFHQLQMPRPKIIKFILKNEQCSFSLL